MIQQKLKKLLLIGLVMVSGSLTSLASAFNCPLLTVEDVRNTIERGDIETDKNDTLAVEANSSEERVKQDEPSANPSDTYYHMATKINFDDKFYWIFIGNVLGGSSDEARERAKEILLNNEKFFMGSYDEEARFCLYKQIDASRNLSGYPFKSRFETVVLIVAPDQKQ